MCGSAPLCVMILLVVLYLDTLVVVTDLETTSAQVDSCCEVVQTVNTWFHIVGLDHFQKFLGHNRDLVGGRSWLSCSFLKMQLKALAS